MPLELAFFDFDGTLIASNEVKRAVFFEVIEPYPQLAADLDRLLDEHPPLNRYQLFEELAASATRSVDVPPPHVMADRYTHLVERAIASCPHVPGAMAAVRMLRGRGVRCHIVSDTPHDSLERVVKVHRLWPEVDAVMGGPTKKEVHIARVLNDTGASPLESLVIGDGDTDREAARVIGCHFVRVGAAHALPADRHAIADLTQLRAVVEHLLQRQPQ